GEAAEVVVGGAGALRGDHAGADGRLGCAGGAEDLALPRPQDAFQHLAALARLRVRDPYSWYGEARLGVEGRVRVAHPQRGVGEEAQDRKSTRLNSSHVKISYAVFCLK